MLNSNLTNTAADALAKGVLRTMDLTDADRVRLVFLKTLSREPSSKEVEQTLAFVKSQNRLKDQSDPSAAWRDLCLALFNTNEFLYVD